MTQAAPTLDGCFRAHALERPDAIALRDAPDRAALAGVAPRTLTYAQADAAVARLAEQLRRWGLPPGACVAVQLPNIVEAPLTLLAILRAGLVAAPLPLLWRKADAVAALTAANARALISCGRVGDVSYGAVAREIAGGVFGIRAVAGFGPDLPDGMLPLDAIFDPNGDDDADATGHIVSGQSAIVTFDTGRNGIAAVPRTDSAWLLGGLTMVAETGLRRHGTILATPPASSFAAIAATFATWIAAGATLTLHHPFDPETLASQRRDCSYDLVVVPGPLVGDLRDAGLIGEASEVMLAVWRSPDRHARDAAWTGGGRIVDLLAFGEDGVLVLARRGDGTPRPIAPGIHTAPSGRAGAPTVATVTCTARGTLAVAGPLAAGGSEAGAIDTGYPCAVDAATGSLAVTGPPPGLVGIGGYRFALEALQDVVGRADAASILTALPDLLAGQRLAGASPDPAAMRAALAALGVNPLVEAAFRARDGGPPAA